MREGMDHQMRRRRSLPDRDHPGAAGTHADLQIRHEEQKGSYAVHGGRSQEDCKAPPGRNDQSKGRAVMDIREKTVLIIKKGGEYLVGTILCSTDLRWSLSPWDAWATRTRENAEAVAEKVDGTVMLFNPIVGQIREAKFL